EIRTRHHRRAHLRAETNMVGRRKLVGAEVTIAGSIARSAPLIAVELEIGAFAPARRRNGPAIELYESPVPVLDTRIVQELREPIRRSEVAGDSFAVAIEMEQHVLAYLVLLSVAI